MSITKDEWVQFKSSEPFNAIIRRLAADLETNKQMLVRNAARASAEEFQRQGIQANQQQALVMWLKDVKMEDVE